MNELCANRYFDHRDRVPEHTKTTCDWFLRESRFHNWRQERKSSLLWYTADPGCGKSVLSSFLIRELQSPASQASFPGTVCYFFFRDDNDVQSRATSGICALLHQFLSARHDLVSSFMYEYHTWGSALRDNFSVLWRMFTSMALEETSKNVICVLDGLDECEDMSRKKLLDALANFYSSEAAHRAEPGFLKCLITSRPYTWIERSFYRLPEIRLKGEERIEVLDEDIKVFIQQRMGQIARMKRLSADTRGSVQDKLVAFAGHTFLWAALILEIIENAPSASRTSLLHILETIPPSLDALYKKILNKSPDIEKTRKVLHIVLGANTALSLTEMSIALNVGEKHRAYVELETDLEPSIENTIKDLCGLFVRCINSRLYLVHQTAKAYLLTEKQYRHGCWKQSFELKDCDFVLSKPA